MGRSEKDQKPKGHYYSPVGDCDICYDLKGREDYAVVIVDPYEYPAFYLMHKAGHSAWKIVDANEFDDMNDEDEWIRRRRFAARFHRMEGEFKGGTTVFSVSLDFDRAMRSMSDNDEMDEEPFEFDFKPIVREETKKRESKSRRSTYAGINISYKL